MIGASAGALTTGTVAVAGGWPADIHRRLYEGVSDSRGHRVTPASRARRILDVCAPFRGYRRPRSRPVAPGARTEARTEDGSGDGSGTDRGHVHAGSRGQTMPPEDIEGIAL